MKKQQIFNDMLAKLNHDEVVAEKRVFGRATVVFDPEKKEVEVTPRKRNDSPNLRIFAQDNVKVMTRKDGTFMMYCEMKRSQLKRKDEIVQRVKAGVDATARYVRGTTRR